MAGGGLVLGYYVRPEARADAAKADVKNAEGSFAPNAFIRIGPDGTVTVYSARPEVGQGIKTSLPMVVAEELGADWGSVKVGSAQLDPVFGPQFAGGSMWPPPVAGGGRQRVAPRPGPFGEGRAPRGGAAPAGECVAAGGMVRH